MVCSCVVVFNCGETEGPVVAPPTDVPAGWSPEGLCGDRWRLVLIGLLYGFMVGLCVSVVIQRRFDGTVGTVGASAALWRLY